MNNRQVGAGWEQIAAEFLQKQGLVILERNFRNRNGEIDIIGRHNGYLVFVEVKFRSSNRQGEPGQAVDYRKQRRICKVADYYRMLHRLDDQTPVRYDVVSIKEDKLEWIPNAFFHIR